MPLFSVRLSGEKLSYSAVHFIVLPNGVCEPAHGHNFRVAIELWGPLDSFHCVVDFIALERMLLAILGEFDHAVLLPAESTLLRIEAREVEFEVLASDRRWIFPRHECRLLPLASTTAERVAEYIGHRLLAALQAANYPLPDKLRVELAESPGRLAICEF